MVMVFIQPTTESRDMHPSMIKEDQPKEFILTLADRCDRCGSQALVMIKGVSGELMFCGHHFNKVMNDPVGYEKMMSYAFEIVDEREKIVENRLIGGHNQ